MTQRNKNTKPSFGILGAGSWGSALGILLARNNHKVLIWDINTQLLSSINKNRENNTYLPGIKFPENLQPAESAKQVIYECDILLLVIPSSAFRETLIEFKDLINRKKYICWATKGLDSSSGGLLHQTVADILGKNIIPAIISGPNFAKEVASGLPTAVTVASPDISFADAVADSLRSSVFRPYTSQDIVGVEVGGSIKNVLAVAAGISDGLGYGANARAGLITRGLNEMTRLGVAFGGKIETFMGLSGVGDLVLTCTDNQSRNRRFGIGLGQGKTLEKIQNEIGQAIEGLRTAKEVYSLSKNLNIELPICEQVYKVIYENKPAKEAVNDLLNRPPKAE
ncbi:MAG: NAD(P)-dependent glycerol-3-phosphate dehydrogenase [Gammaproteobacteria bacterium]|nr:MAG: NAD(P)-dependent glycerol-3-phosphate dehydrogenase [Gammaproteobacteria bacterium]